MAGFETPLFGSIVGGQRVLMVVVATDVDSLIGNCWRRSYGIPRFYTPLFIPTGSLQGVHVIVIVPDIDGSISNRRRRPYSILCLEVPPFRAIA